MTASMCRTLRTAGIWLLGFAAPVAACAWAPVRAGSGPEAIADLSPAIPVSPTAAKHSSPAGKLDCFAVQLTAPAKSAGHRSSRRISAEDTTPPSPDALETTRLEVPMEPRARMRPPAPVRRNAFASPATRQRAP